MPQPTFDPHLGDSIRTAVEQAPGLVMKAFARDAWAHIETGAWSAALGAIMGVALLVAVRMQEVLTDYAEPLLGARWARRRRRALSVGLVTLLALLSIAAQILRSQGH